MTEFEQDTAQSPSPVAPAMPLAKPAALAPGKTIRNYTFGSKTIGVPDPFADLENNSQATKDWVKSQDDYARQVLNGLPDLNSFLKNYIRFTSIATVDAPKIAGDYLFSKERRAGEDQPRFLVRSKAGVEERTLVDPNKLTGKVSVDDFFPSPDGKLVVVALSEGGNEASVLRVLDTATGKEVSPRIPRSNWPSVAWLSDSSGVYFTQYPVPGTVPKNEEQYHRKIFFTKIGSNSQVEMTVPGQKLADFPFVGTSEVLPWMGFGNANASGNSITLKSLSDNKEFPIVRDPAKTLNDFIFTSKGIGINTTENAPNGRFVEIELPKNGIMSELPRQKEILPESKTMILKQVASADGLLLAHYSDNLKSRLIVYDGNGKEQREVTLPSVGTVTKITASETGKEVYFQFTTFSTPPQVLKLDVNSGKTEVISKVELPFDASKYQVTQIWTKSKDGTKVPAFVIEAKNAVHNGKSPTLLTGYGGFNRSQLPEFSSPYASWLEQGGTIVVANIRGGGEFGEKWHQGGMRDKKQNVFDDFIAVAQQLIKSKITSPDHLAITGGSNGGLLVAAVINQKPELFAAAAVRVPLTDMLRYDQSKIAKLWVPEYGSASNSETELNYLKKYSPYGNVNPKKVYPAVIVTNGENDSRVDPIHARKFAAELQATARSRGEILLSTNFNSGHGVNESLSVARLNNAQWLAFLWKEVTKEPTKKSH